MRWKVTKMAAAARVVVQAVRPHAPLIKFPNRLGVPKLDVQEALNMAAPPHSSGTHSLPQPVASRPSGMATPAPQHHVTTPPDTAATIRALPQKYRRRALAVEEMDYIQRGGPE